MQIQQTPASPPRSPITISVITVCYNAAQDLARTLESVSSQSYPHVEYILIDGASTDDTPSLLEAYRGSIDHLISEPDGGIYEAMNKGLRLATGEYLCFMNAGDCFHSSETLSEVFEKVAGLPTLPDVIYGETILVDAHGQFVAPRHHKVPEQLSYDSFREGMLVCHQSFYPLSTLVAPYDEKYRLSADFDWCLKILSKASSTYNTGQILTDYLCQGATTRHRWRSWRERFEIMRSHYGLGFALLAHVRFLCRRIFK